MSKGHGKIIKAANKKKVIKIHLQGKNKLDFHKFVSNC